MRNVDKRHSDYNKYAFMWQFMRDSVDGEKAMKVVRDRVSFSIGSTYDIVGMITLQNYSPAFHFYICYSNIDG